MATDKNPGFEKIVDMFEGAKKFTEDLLRENERLRGVNQSLKSAVREATSSGADGLPHLKKRVVLLEEENSLLRQELGELKQQYNSMEKENWDFAERYLQVERQNASLLNLYVASQRLHSTLDFGEVVQILREIVINLIGSEHFDIVLYDAAEDTALTLTSLASCDSTVGHRVARETILESLRSGEIHIAKPENGDSNEWQACVPLRAAENTLGAIVVHSLLPQKAGLEGVDYELFDLLAEHAAVVLCAAHAFSGTGSWENVGDRAELVRTIAERAQQELSFPSGHAPSA